jgi:hypothetical protein
MREQVRASRPRSFATSPYIGITGKTQTVRAWDARYRFRVRAADGDALGGECEVVKDEERTVGIEVHDVVLGQRNVMVWDHGGQLEVRACWRTQLALHE